MANQSIFTGSPHSLSVLVVEDECFIAMDIEMLLERISRNRARCIEFRSPAHSGRFGSRCRRP